MVKLKSGDFLNAAVQVPPTQFPAMLLIDCIIVTRRSCHGIW